MGELRKRGDVWWIRYYRNGKRHEESSRSTSKEVARDVLRRREGAIADGIPVTAKLNRFRFEEAATDALTEYKVNGRRSLDELERRIEKHLAPYFAGRRMASITTTDVRTYIAQRQSAREVVKKAYTLTRKDGTTVTVPEQRRPSNGASNAEINRELTILKRMFRWRCRPGSFSIGRTFPCWRNGTPGRDSSSRKRFTESSPTCLSRCDRSSSLPTSRAGGFLLKCSRLSGARSASGRAKSGWTP